MGIGQIDTTLHAREHGAPSPYGQRLRWDAESRLTAMRGEGRLAAILFLICPLVALPSALLISPRPGAAFLPLVALALLIGLVCLTLPWERMSRVWLHAPAVIATAQVTALAAAADSSFVFFFVFIAIYAALISRRPAALVAHLGLISLGLLSPLLLDPGTTPSTLQMALVGIPALALSAGMVYYLRERLEADRRAYRRFAQEALSIAARIRGEEPQPVDPALLAPEPVTPPLPGLPAGLRRVALGSLGVLVTAACVPVALATAGIALPPLATEPFEKLGVSLPNQGGQQAVSGPGSENPAEPPRESGLARSQSSAVAAGTRGPQRADPSSRGAPDPDASGGAAPRGDGSGGTVASTYGAGTPTGSARDTEAHSTQAQPGDSSADLRDSIDDTLRDPLDPVDRLLGDRLRWR